MPGKSGAGTQGGTLERLVTLESVVEPSLARGRVKFFLTEKGWGGIESSQLPHDVFVHFSVIDTAGYRSLDAGDRVEFRYEDCAGVQDSWQYRATWVRRLPA